MAMTVNGYIAKENDETGFVSDIEWNNFQKIAKDIGNMIVGSRTYKIMVEKEEFNKLCNVRVVIVSDNTDIKIISNNHSIATSPQDALTTLEKEGYRSALVAGGATLNSSFMAKNLINEIYLDVEPIAFGKGIKLFKDNDFEAKLKLLSTKKLSDDEIQLHYKVQK